MAPAFAPRKAILNSAPSKLNELLELPESGIVPEYIVPAVAHAAARFGMLRLGDQSDINWREINNAKRIQKGKAGHRPMLLIHSADDPVIPSGTSETLNRSNPNVELKLYQLMGHVEGWNKHPETFKEVISEFIDKRFIRNRL